MESVRLPRFKRAPEIAPIQLTGRDREIIRLVHRHRFLRSSHITALIGGSPQQVLRRLQLLYHHGFLERPRAQIDYYHQGGSRCLAYGLGNKGAALLKRELPVSQHHLDWSVKNAAVGRLFLEHAVMASDVMVALEIACRESGQVHLLTGDEIPLPPDTRNRRKPFQWRVTLANRLRLGVFPDRALALEFTDPPKERNRILYFLEVDRATMPITRHNLAQSSFHRKLLAYEATWAQRLHQTRFGFHRFRVITVTTSSARADSLAATCRQLPRGHGLFLFTDIASLRIHRNLLTLPFLTGHTGETTTLFA